MKKIAALLTFVLAFIAFYIADQYYDMRHVEKLIPVLVVVSLVGSIFVLKKQNSDLKKQSGELRK